MDDDDDIMHLCRHCIHNSNTLSIQIEKMSVIIVSENGTEIFGSLGSLERRDCLLRGISEENEKVALNFCGGIVSIVRCEIV